MAFSATARQDRIATINITPLVDVMLVLLVIFMIAAPVLSRPIDLDLPGRAPSKQVAPTSPITLRISSAGDLYWNDSPTPLSALPAMLAAEAQRDPAHPPMLRIDASGEVDYDVVVKVLAAAKHAELRNIRFVR